jgi:hypothetical protein
LEESWLSQSAVTELEATFKFLQIDVQSICDITVDKIEAIITPENKNTAHDYIRKLYAKWDAKFYWRDMISSFESHSGFPITNAYYLHEYYESLLIQEKLVDVLNVDVPIDLHLRAALLHSFYLYLKCLDDWLVVTYEEVLAFEPVSDWIDQKFLCGKHGMSKINQDKTHVLVKYFTNILQKEYRYCVFDWEPALWKWELYKSA